MYLANKHHTSNGYINPHSLDSLLAIFFFFLFLDRFDLDVVLSADDSSSPSSADSESKSVLSYQGIVFSFSASLTIAAAKEK